jgi:maltodextrin utilization protein YvdJ
LADQAFFVNLWFIYLISVGSFVWLYRNKKLKPEYLALYISGLFYFGSFVLFGNAADARLLFYTTTTSSLIIFATFIEIYLKVKR